MVKILELRYANAFYVVNLFLFFAYLDNYNTRGEIMH